MGFRCRDWCPKRAHLGGFLDTHEARKSLRSARTWDKSEVHFRLAQLCIGNRDAILVFSVGGGNREKNVSVNLVRSIELAKEVGAKVYGIVGKDGGYTAKVADACVIVPTVNANNVTPHSEAFQAVVWHLWVSHPDVKINQTKWESVVAAKP